MLLIGIIEENNSRNILNITKQILLESKYKIIYENVLDNIVGVSKGNNILLLFDFVSKDLQEKNYTKIHFDIVVHSFISEKEFSYYDDIFRMSKICILNSDDKDMIQILSKLENVLSITYGLNSKASVTISSVNINSYIEANLCLQRDLVPINGEKVEPCEFYIETNSNNEKHIYPILAASTLCLLTGDSILNKKLTNSIKLVI